jgi:hypothetical protein
MLATDTMQMSANQHEPLEEHHETRANSGVQQHGSFADPADSL